MIYTPSRYPRKAFLLVTLMASFGIIWGYFISDFFMAVALIFWMQYTAILSYLQFRRKSRHTHTGFTKHILVPEIRFFVFEFIAVLGIGTLIFYNTIIVGAVSLAVWWLFSLNFYSYYLKKRYKK